ncbi:MAG TPA: DinB family protein [Gemmatimonadaceae bacterium]|nr:DinB family protein [Gemmatimonadaceae bacterium]
MQQRLAELLSYLDSTREQLLATVSNVNPSFAGVRPRGESWSAADNLAHLALVEERIARLVEEGVEWAKANGVGPETSDESIMSSLDRFSLTDAVKKRTAPPMITPEEGKTVEESVEALLGWRARLKAALLASQGLDLTQVTKPHPVAGAMSMYQWGLFVAQHEERHRRQIERTMDEVTELCAESAPIV